MQRRTRSSGCCTSVCGTDDGLLGINQQFRDYLTRKGVKFTYSETPGYAHVWPLWRRNLVEIVPMLFQTAVPR